MHYIEGTNKAVGDTGRWEFTDGPPATTVPAAWLNAVQYEIANVIEAAGINLLTASSDSKDQLNTAIRRVVTEYDYVVTSQSTFNDLFERIGANQYQIKSQYKSVYFRDLSGGYLCSGTTSFLNTGLGDTYAEIQTNQCEVLTAQTGGYINMGDTAGYIHVNTSGCILSNIDVRGTGVAAAISYSFLNNQSNVMFYNCKTSNRLSNTTFACFNGANDTAKDNTSKYLGCIVEDCTSSGTIYGFYRCRNIIGSQVIDLESTDGTCYGMHSCNYLSAVVITDLDSGTGAGAGTCVGFYNCNRITAFILQNLNAGNGNCIGIQGTGGAAGSFYIASGSVSGIHSTGGNAYGVLGAGSSSLQKCLNISTAIFTDIDSTAGSVYGMQYVNNITACILYDLDTSNAGSSVYGFHTCDNIGQSQVLDLDITGGGAGTVQGMNTCSQIVACEVFTLDSNGTGNVYGFNGCSNLSSVDTNALQANSGDCYGFNSCDYMSAFSASSIASTSGDIFSYVDCDNIDLYFSGQTTNATPTEIFVDGITNNRWSIPSGTSSNFIALISAIKSDESQSKTWKIEGQVHRDGSANPYVAIQKKEILSQINWDISTAVYLQEFSVAAKEINPSNVFFKPDGSKMYTIGFDGDTVDEYDLSTAWDVSTAVYLQEFSVAAKEGVAYGLFFKPDGSKMYTLGEDGDTVDEYDLSTAWDVSTAVYLQEITANGNGTEGSPSGLFFKPDGTKFYYVGISTDDVFEHTLSTPWDVSTAVYTQNKDVSAKETSLHDVFFKPDGSKMYTLGENGDTVDEYDLSTAWDISTAVYLQEFSVAAKEINPYGLFFKPDGSKMYTIGIDGDTVDEYDLELDWDILFEQYLDTNSIIPKVVGVAATTINWKIKIIKMEH